MRGHGPNAAGVASYADVGRMVTKPYAASGRDIERNEERLRHNRRMQMPYRNFDRMRQRG